MAPEVVQVTTHASLDEQAGAGESDGSEQTQGFEDDHAPAAHSREVPPPRFSNDARSRPSFGKPDIDEAVPNYIEPKPGRFAHLSKGPSQQVMKLRADIKAASIVTELVAAMAVHPGSGAETMVKQKALTSILALARQSASELVSRVDSERSDVGWVKAQALSMTSHILAKEWSAGAPGTSFEDVRERFVSRMELVTAILDDESGEVALAMDEFASGDSYKKVDSAQSAADHRVVGIHQASWEFAAAVDAVRGRAGDVFSFGLSAESIVQTLLQKTFDVVSASRPEITDAEAALTYWRGAMRRATSLVCAEYRSKAIETCNWVDDVTGPDREERLAQCPSVFERQAAPFIHEWAMKNFQSIERASKKLIEDVTDVQKPTDRPGH